jgi:hypothetical protein
MPARSPITPLRLLDDDSAGQSTGELLVEFLTFDHDPMLQDGDRGQIGERSCDENVTLVLGKFLDAKEIQRPDSRVAEAKWERRDRSEPRSEGDFGDLRPGS